MWNGGWLHLDNLLEKLLEGITTGYRPFAVCPGHMAKAIFPTAKCLPCVAHGKLHTANKRRQRAPLPSVFLCALGKSFAVC